MPRFNWLGPLGWSPLVETVPGGYRVNLGRAEQRLVMEALDELRVMLANQDPATRRLFPTAYVDDAALDAEYQKMVGDDLLQGQLEALDLVERTIDGQTIDRDELEGWMRAINGVRLALGTRLDVSEEGVVIDPDDPNAHLLFMYEVMGVLLGAMLQALAAS
jgi:Domain of unknown function (DUF2017)